MYIYGSHCEFVKFCGGFVCIYGYFVCHFEDYLPFLGDFKCICGSFVCHCGDFVDLWKFFSEFVEVMSVSVKKI